VADLADPPKDRTPQARVWTPDQTTRYLASIEEDRLAALWRLAATTGMRRSELLGLAWDSVDLEAGVLTVTQTLVVVSYRLELSEPKTEAGRRTVALDPQTVRSLQRHRARQLEERLACGQGWKETGLVFTREDGSPIHPERVSTWFKQRVRAASLPPLGIHGLRHSYVTMLLRSGEPVRVVSRRVGHGGPNVTTAIYAHVLPGDDKAAALKGARLLDQVRPTKD
jgi:integrase